MQLPREHRLRQRRRGARDRRAGRPREASRGAAGDVAAGDDDVDVAASGAVDNAGDVLGRMLQVAVHDQAPPRPRGVEALQHGSAEARVGGIAVDEPDREVRGIRHLSDDIGGLIGGVVDEDDLEVRPGQGRSDATDQLGDVRPLVEGGDDDGQFHVGGSRSSGGRDRLSVTAGLTACPVCDLSVRYATRRCHLSFTTAAAGAAAHPMRSFRAATPMPKLMRTHGSASLSEPTET